MRETRSGRSLERGEEIRSEVNGICCWVRCSMRRWDKEARVVRDVEAILGWGGGGGGCDFGTFGHLW